MRSPLTSSTAITVGIDGSRAAISAAVWAVDEAVHRDIPLRLVYAIEQRDPSRDGDTTRDQANAENAVRAAVAAVESTERPVKIEAEIVRGPAVRVLRELSYSAEMLCLGVLGLGRATGRRVGSTAAALADTANCPVAMIRTDARSSCDSRWIVAEVDESADSLDVVETAVDESLLRRLPLRVLTAWHARFNDMSGARTVADNNRILRARQERLLAQYRTRHPELDARAVAVHGSTLSYLTCHAPEVELIVIGRHRTGGFAKLRDAACQSALHEMRCSVLICPAAQTM